MKEIPDDKSIEDQLAYYRGLSIKCEKKIQYLNNIIGELKVKIDMLEEENDDMRNQMEE